MSLEDLAQPPDHLTQLCFLSPWCRFNRRPGGGGPVEVVIFKLLAVGPFFKENRMSFLGLPQ